MCVFSLSIIFLFVGLARIPAAQTSTYGSGDFGTWVIDNHGLPSFAVNSSMNDKLGQVAYFTHQIGNDRVVALTTHGTVSLRQDEGGPKLLNDYVAEDAQIRGGFWLRQRREERSGVVQVRKCLDVPPQEPHPEVLSHAWRWLLSQAIYRPWCDCR